MSVESLGREEKWVQLVCRDLKESLVHLVQMGQRYGTAPSPLCAVKVKGEYSVPNYIIRSERHIMQDETNVWTHSQ